MPGDFIIVVVYDIIRINIIVIGVHGDKNISVACCSRPLPYLPSRRTVTPAPMFRVISEYVVRCGLRTVLSLVDLRVQD